MELKTHTDNGWSLLSYCDKIFCHCPKCDGKAIITAELTHLPNWCKNVRMQCLTCTFHEVRSENKLYGNVLGYARERCSVCGYKYLSAEVKGTAGKRLKKSLCIECPSCHQTITLTLTWCNNWQSKDPFDPYFGRPLWLQIECCGNNLWAYNETHLQTLKSYIGAELRDGKLRKKWSLTTRLPQWMTAAKNRDAVLRCLNKLESAILDK